jgi:hypothetical protein
MSSNEEKPNDELVAVLSKVRDDVLLQKKQLEEVKIKVALLHIRLYLLAYFNCETDDERRTLVKQNKSSLLESLYIPEKTGFLY